MRGLLGLVASLMRQNTTDSGDNPITQNSYFTTYNDNPTKDDKNLKDRCKYYGISLKQRLCRNQSHPDKENELVQHLNGISKSIQHQINQASLHFGDIERYAGEIVEKLSDCSRYEEAKDYIYCCILLSKHMTNEDTIVNYMGLTNQTRGIVDLQRTNSRQPSPAETKSMTSHELRVLLLDILNKDQKKALAESLGTLSTNYMVTNSNWEEQRTIANAIKDGKFGSDADVLKALATSLGSMGITDWKAQQDIAQAINTDKFGLDADALKALATSLSSMKITNSAAKVIIAKAIENGKFGTTLDALDSLATYLNENDIRKNIIIVPEPELNLFIHGYLSESKFKNLGKYLLDDHQNNNPDKILLDKISAYLENKYTSPIMFFYDINNIRRFPLLIRKMAIEILGKIPTIMNNDATTIVNLIDCCFLGRHPMIFTAWGNCLKTMNMDGITNTEAQLNIVGALLHHKFGEASANALIVLKTILGKMNIEDVSIQRRFVRMVNERQYNLNRAMLPILAGHILCKIIDNKARISIAKSIFEEKWGARSTLSLPILKLFTEIVAELAYTPDTQNKIISFISKETAQIAAIENFKQYVRSHWLVGNDFFAYRDIRVDSTNEDGYEKYFHGDIDITDTNIEPTAKPGLAFGFVYDLAGKAELLIVYNDITDGLDDNTKQEHLRGFFSPYASHAIIYMGCLRNVRVFNLQSNNGYIAEMRLDIPNHYPRFPAWLRLAIDCNKFNLNDYTDRHLIQFALDLANLAQEPLNSLPDKPANEPPYSELVKQVIQRLVTLEGDFIFLDSDRQKDAQIKDRINASFQPFDECNKTTIDGFWSQLSTPQEKAKLIFLVGQIAKKGALGYHIVDQETGIDKNQANVFFYCLATYYTEKLLSEKDSNLVGVSDLHDGLKVGTCIEALTNTFSIANGGLQSVWSKRAI